MLLGDIPVFFILFIKRDLLVQNQYEVLVEDYIDILSVQEISNPTKKNNERL